MYLTVRSIGEVRSPTITEAVNSPQRMSHNSHSLQPHFSPLNISGLNQIPDSSLLRS